MFLEWQATVSQADRYAPDRREYDFTATQVQRIRLGSRLPSTSKRQTISSRHFLRGFILEPGTIIRRYDELVDDNFDVSADITWDVYDAGASFGQLKAGFQLIYRERDSDSATYGFNVNQIRDDLLRTENLLVSDVVYTCDGGNNRPGCQPGGEGGISSSPNTGLVFVDKTLASDSYDAELEYNSAYLMYDHTFDSVWQVILGGRYETYEQTTNTFSLQGAQGAVQSVIDEDSFAQLGRELVHQRRTPASLRSLANRRSP